MTGFWARESSWQRTRRNFIANRIGVFSTLDVLRIIEEDGYSIEEIDALTGPVLGMPKSATFRTLDIIGLDVLAHVVHNLCTALPDDERRDLFQIPGFVEQMIERRLLGDKTGQGFYKKVKGKEGDEILTLDLATFEYRSRQRAAFPSLEMARNLDDLRERIQLLCQAPDRAGRLYRRFFSDIFHYAAMRVPEISDDVVAIDNAMKWDLAGRWARSSFGTPVVWNRSPQTGRKRIGPCHRCWKNCAPRGAYPFMVKTMEPPPTSMEPPPNIARYRSGLGVGVVLPSLKARHGS